MAYTPFEWFDGEDGGTPITAERLNALEQGIADVELEPGPKGDKGDDGPEGPQGPKGDKGNDGFPTESQWNDLVADVSDLADRVTALED